MNDCGYGLASLRFPLQVGNGLAEIKLFFPHFAVIIRLTHIAVFLMLPYRKGNFYKILS